MLEPMQTLLQRDLNPHSGSLVELEPHSRLPRLDLGIDWESGREGFISSLRGFVSGPRAAKEAELTKDGSFQVDWIRGALPGRAFVASSLWHVAAIWLLVLPIWGFLPENTPTLAPVQIELTWQPQDLPRIFLPAPVPKPAAAPDQPKKMAAEAPKSSDADASRARQTILSIPVVVTHPRQTLVRPDAPSAPPKIVPLLPNIVQWSTPQLEKPKFHLPASTAAPKVQRSAIWDIAAPDVPNAVNLALNLASKAPSIQRPKMPVSATSAPMARQQEKHDAATAPEIGAAADSSERPIIALSATPGPPAPAVSVPEGNLAARISISPEGKKTGEAGDSANHSKETGAGGSAAATTTGGVSAAGGSSNNLPAAISITGGNASSNRGGIAPSANRLGTLGPKSSGPYEPASTSRRAPPNVSALDPSLPPEKILSGSEVYTLHVNLPNLTSASGSWILSFSELDEGAQPPFTQRERLAAPVPVQKADPKYPPELIKEHVQGEIVLYAIIRKDGSVDSIQVVRDLDPQLDQNAIQALSEWKFRPATRAGQPVDIEAVVHIPFLYQDPRDYNSR